MPDEKPGPIAAPQRFWLRHDWQHNPLAPGLKCVQALTISGQTASGAALSRHDAYMRCLGETAEIIAINAMAQRHIPKSLETGSEGVAAGPNTRFAAYKALCERLERWAIFEWWAGNLVAAKLPGPYCHQAGITGTIEKLRAGALEKRQTGVWALPGFDTLEIAIALSTDEDSGRPILGFGADICPVAAAKSALTEMALMELNLQQTESDRMKRYFLSLSSDHEALFPAVQSIGGKASILSLPQKYNHLTRRLTERNIPFSLQNLAAENTGLDVVSAILPNAPGFSGEYRAKARPLL